MRKRKNNSKNRSQKSGARSQNVAINLQIASKTENIPQEITFKKWVNAVLDHKIEKAEVTIRVVDKEESAKLNETYRHKQGPTNVLSFTYESPPNEQEYLLGDIVICAPIIQQEAQQQRKTQLTHWAHLVIHGTLHLLGYDHVYPKDAAIMEALEIEILQRLGFENPYA